MPTYGHYDATHRVLRMQTCTRTLTELQSDASIPLINSEKFPKGLSYTDLICNRVFHWYPSTYGQEAW